MCLPERQGTLRVRKRELDFSHASDVQLISSAGLIKTSS